MFNVGGGELLVIMLIALMVLGPQRLPDAARQVGKVMAEVRRVSSGFQRELKEALDAEPDVNTPPRRKEATPLAASVAEADAAAASSDVGDQDEPADEATSEPATLADETADAPATTTADASADATVAGTADASAGTTADESADVSVAADVTVAADADAAAQIVETPAEATADETATVEPVRPTIAPAVADALDEIAAPLDDERAAS